MTSLIDFGQSALANIHRAATPITEATTLSYMTSAIASRLFTRLSLNPTQCATFTALFSAAGLAYLTLKSKTETKVTNKKELVSAITSFAGLAYGAYHVSGSEKALTPIITTAVIAAGAIFASLYTLNSGELKKNSETSGLQMLQNAALNIHRISFAGSVAWALNRYIAPLSFYSKHTALLTTIASTTYFLAEPFFEDTKISREDLKSKAINLANRCISWLVLTKLAANYLEISMAWDRKSALAVGISAAVIAAKRLNLS